MLRLVRPTVSLGRHGNFANAVRFASAVQHTATHTPGAPVPLKQITMLGAVSDSRRHIMPYTPIPFYGFVSAAIFATTMVGWMHGGYPPLLFALPGLALLTIALMRKLSFKALDRDLTVEMVLGKFNTNYIHGVMLGVLLLIFTEVAIFLTVIGLYFYFAVRSDPWATLCGETSTLVGQAFAPAI
eukprot:TRINITY_DN82857_c0_g1_i1.p1 TRINITY_DN82857_c0_g1~~TRINITY_DN82857_c0_g1_i1.p1  ORF type:complete len:185 (+),score=32.81 TRINITY_DN82857_c0_g1_i1:46-600(+)